MVMVKWTDHAKTQLRQIHDYIAQDSTVYAGRVTEALARKTVSLELTPRLGHKVPELNNDAVRELSEYSYRILYEIMPDYVAVLAVIHKRRDLHADDITREEQQD